MTNGSLKIQIILDRSAPVAKFPKCKTLGATKNCVNVRTTTDFALHLGYNGQ